MSAPLVHARDITRHFPPATAALRGASLTVERGESLAIMGPSGSGKSTLLAILGLLDQPTSGTYELDGADVTRATDRQRTQLRRTTIGYVFQAFHLISHLTVAENVSFALQTQGQRWRQAAQRTEEILALVGLTDRANAYPATLSGGEQQRTAVARAVARRPQLLLCDEPTGNLDRANSSAVLDLLVGVPNDATAVVLVTHDAHVASRCDRTLHVLDGQVNNP